LRDQVVLASNGELALAIPLFKKTSVHTYGIDYRYECFIDDHLAYMIVTRVGAIVWSKEFVEDNFEFLGDL
jgi:hypothetical protein